MSEAGDCIAVPASEEKKLAVDQNGNKMDEKGAATATENNPTNPSANADEKKLEDTIPSIDFPSLLDSRSSTPSEGNTPRDYDTSSGSPSPVPDDGSDGPGRPKINLGRDISLMMQALNSLHSPEEKIAALCKKYADLLEQQKLKDKKMRGVERRSAQVAKENDQIQKDLNKAILGKSKMESLARELNKQNKLLKEETYNLTLSHNKEREQISAKFEAAADEISGKINAIADRNELLNEQNREMSEKISNLVKETASREQMVKAMMDQRDLQEQILELKLKKAEEEKDLAMKDVESLRREVEKYQALCEGYLKQEKELKTQITYYSEKVADFQSISDKSNKIFKTFRSEVDAMNAKMKDLEKATSTWKKNYEQCEVENKRILGENMEQARKLNLLNIKVTKLSNLSRALQAERNDLAKKVTSLEKKANTVTAEATSTVTQPPQPTGPPKRVQSRSAPSNPTLTGRVSPDSSTGGTETTPTSQSIEMVQEAPSSSAEDPPTSPDNPGPTPQSTDLPVQPQSAPSEKAEADSTSEATVTQTSESAVSSSTDQSSPE